MNVDIYPVIGKKVWPLFAPHHYLTSSLASNSRCFIAVLDDGEPVAFTSHTPFVSGTVLNSRREHRTVVLPDFQGLGLGSRLSDWLGAHVLGTGQRFFSKTMHPRMGAYREASPLWRATSGNGKPQSASAGGVWQMPGRHRRAFSHEYLGTGMGA